MIRGKKNYLSPVRLELGFGVLFMTDEESAKARKARFIARGGFDAQSAEASVDAAADAADAAAARAAAGPRLRKFERKRLRRLAEEGQDGSADELIVGATDATGAPSSSDAAAPPLPAANGGAASGNAAEGEFYLPLHFSRILLTI